ncbi:HBL003Cp [Eremothecium sinecaudum]|uniref:HBL003Cp n=1 Tax=Eremothecium sinecaudum TaxID=45286 RepID=A0A120K111_9SACH|nr:HBL003Cp [Eremothecium sinecaudum]AMD18899.1 HBL003Cp [Eremothecium sinecaudum]
MPSTILSHLNLLRKEDDKEIDAASASDVEAAEHFVAELDKGEKRLGIISSIGLICNRMMGTAIFVVTSDIYKLVGSVGLTLILWVVGAAIALTGLYVYMEFGTAIPRNGGEKNYLEHIFKKPKFLVTSLYASYAFFLGWAAGNSLIVARMFLIAGNVELTTWNERGAAVGVMFFFFLINSINVKVGLYFQNILGAFKVLTIIFIPIVGIVALCGGIKNAAGTSNFHNAFEGSGDATTYGIVNALYNIIWAFVGYSNVNYALGEVRNPVRTLKRAGPISLILLSILYLLVNIAYFAVVPKEEVHSSGVQISINFFRIAFGEGAKRAGAVFIALSALGNVCSVSFSQARIIQQLGREGVLPFSNFFASSKPFNSPLVGLFQHFVVCVITVCAPPADGYVYFLILNLISYPMNIINTAVSGGLLWIYWQRRQGKIEWDPPIRAGVYVTTAFLLANIYLVFAPYIPPPADMRLDQTLPYWTHCVLAWAIFGVGAIYWFVWTRILPKIGGYKLVYSEVLGEDGFWRNKILKQYDDKPPVEVENSAEASAYSRKTMELSPENSLNNLATKQRN